jgi:hypothetical protein
MPRPTSRRPKHCRLSVTLGAAEQLRAIQQGQSSDPSHVMRLEAESQGFSLWLGPEVAGDVVLGSEETYQLRVSPEQARYMAGENLIVDYWEASPMGPCLIVYREDEPPPHLRSPRRRHTRVESGRRKKNGSPMPPGRVARTAEPDAHSGYRKRTAPGKRKTTRPTSPTKSGR